MLAVNMADVISVVKSVAPHLVAIATLFVAAIVVMFITRKKKTALAIAVVVYLLLVEGSFSVKAL